MLSLENLQLVVAVSGWRRGWEAPPQPRDERLVICVTAMRLPPLLHEGVRQRVTTHVKDAVAKGGKLLVGGKIPAGEEYAKGFFYEPALIDNAPDNALALTDKYRLREAQVRASIKGNSSDPPPAPSADDKEGASS